MEAKLSNYRQSPRKVRLLADLVRGKKYNQALTILTHTPKRAVPTMVKVLKSAAANAVHNHGADLNNLIVSDIRVDKGVVLKRFMPRARGSSAGIKKRTSHIYVKLTDNQTKVVTEASVAEKAPLKAPSKAPKTASKVTKKKTK